jgi:hypothetical protein
LQSFRRSCGIRAADSRVAWALLQVAFHPKTEHFVQACLRQLIEFRIPAKDYTASLLDLFDRFLTVAQFNTNTCRFDLVLVMSWTLADIMAGVDTTTIRLRAVIYFFVNAETSLSNLKDELRKSNLSYSVSWKEEVS